MIRLSKLVLACGMALLCGACASTSNNTPKPTANASTAVKRILIFGDVSPNNPPWQQALMERSIQQVADAFKAHSYEVDLIPTASLNARVVKDRLAHYQRTLTTNDTFALYSHSHGGPLGTFFANWSELTDSILAMPTRDVLIFAMSCHSGNLPDTLDRRKSEWQGRSQSGRSLVVLTPVSAAQLCGPSPEAGVGNPFTYAVTTAARGAADADANGKIETKELVAYVLKTTREKSRGQSHSPQFAGEFPEGAVFVSAAPSSSIEGK